MSCIAIALGPRASALAVATITLAAACGGGSGSTVAPPPPSTVTITAPRVVAVGATLPSTATVNPSGAVSWSVDNPAIATVSTDGRVTGVAPGLAQLRATSGDATQSAAVAVIPRFTDIALGTRHACALTSAHELYCWRFNRDRELGGPSQDACHAGVGELTTECDAIPRTHAGITLAFNAVDASFDNTCGLTAAGDAYCWGASENGWLTGGTQFTQVPVKAATNQAFVALGSGNAATCALTAAGAAYCWGMDDAGQLGAPVTEQCGSLPCSHSPLPVTGGLTLRSLNFGGSLVCGLTVPGDAYCWGNASSAVYAPVAVSGGLKFSSIAAATGGHSCAITTSAQAYCWGANARGQLGNNSQADSPVPVAVSGGFTFASIAVGWDHSCAITTAGIAYCWGKNKDANGSSGFLGDGTEVDRLQPVPVSGGHVFTRIAANHGFSCGVTTDGAAYCWGSNFYGELGHGETYAISALVPVGIGVP